ncbi:MAG: hypothetical protein M3R17_21310 [Bacteroidota bacterium]|nr:hypothetical protein [Bacteroidota bacterium]
MAEQNRSYLIERFQDGDIPTGSDFADMIDSSLNLLDDGLTSYILTDAHGDHKRFGIGDTAPEAPLGIKAETGHDEELISFTSSDGMHKWNLNLNPTVSNVPGFSIDDSSSGASISRLFIDSGADGKIGIGTVTPLEQLHIAGVADGDMLSVQIQNYSTGHNGWLLSHVDDNAIIERSGAFGIVESDGNSEVERMTFLKKLGAAPNFYNNVGINEMLPFATLHVTRIDTDSDVRLDENTGILLLGAIDSTNLAMDSFNIQARTGSYVAEGPTLDFVASELNLQPLGGDIIIHRSYGLEKRVLITDGGLMGLGKTPVERLDVNGAVTFGDTTTAVPAEGTVRWHRDPAGLGGDLEVFKDGTWQSLTTTTVTDGLWTASPIDGAIYYAPSDGNAKVGIGTTQPTSALTVIENSGVAELSTVAVSILNTAQTFNADPSVVRAGMRIVNSGNWSLNESALNVGLFISGVSGQVNANANLSAVLNGSVVIGTTTGLPIVGPNGTNVLAIQNGEAPTDSPGSTANSGIQIYSALNEDRSTSIFNVMNGNGTVIQLFRQAALPAEDMNNPNTGDVNTDLLISNMRDRIDELELRLQKLGLIL